MLQKTIDHITAAGSPDAVIAAMSALSGHFGYTAMAIGAPSRPDLFGGYFYSTWPSDWIDLYTREGLMRDDPIPRVAALNVAPFLWSDMMAGRCGITMSEEQLRAHRIGRAHGYCEGVVVPIHGPGAYLVIASYGGRDPDTSLSTLTALQIITHQAHARLADLHGFGRKSSLTTSGGSVLTAREIEVLSCIRLGLPDAAAALRLGLTERTVSFHIANARAKLGAQNRAQAVSAALALGLLPP